MGLEMVELLMEVEDEFGIDVPDEEWLGLETVGQVQQHVLRKLQGRPDAPTPDQVLSKLRRICSAISDIPVERIGADSHLLRDLFTH